nr:diguanylate cyclase [Acidobacteriota bacterium]
MPTTKQPEPWGERIEELIKRFASGDFSAADRGDGSSDYHDSTLAMLHQLGEELRVHQEELENLVAQRTSELRVVQSALHLLVLTDELTGMANKPMLKKKLKEANDAAESTGLYPTVLSLDLDGFKLINDTMGHDAGDEVLRRVAKKLREVVTADCTVARLGGDEFAIVIPHATQTEALQLVQRVTRVMNEEIDLLGINIKVLGSLGVRFGEAGLSPEIQLRDADLAMYRSKHDGEGVARVFLPAMAEETRTKLALSSSLRRAVADGELELRYQPVINLSNGGIAAVEALVRWRHAEYGVVSADVFLPLARQNSLMPALGRWVLREALETVAKWRVEGLVSDTFHLSVNMSPMELAFRDLQPTIVALLNEFKIPPANFLVEITELQDV